MGPMSDERKGKHKQRPGENHPQDVKRPPRKGSGRNRPAKGYDATKKVWVGVGSLGKDAPK